MIAFNREMFQPLPIKKPRYYCLSRFYLFVNVPGTLAFDMKILQKIKEFGNLKENQLLDHLTIIPEVSYFTLLNG